MKFLILTQYFPPEPGAAPVRLGSMARELMRLGHQLEVITALPNYPTGRIYPEYRGKFYRTEVTPEGLCIHRLWSYASLGSGMRRILNYVSFAATAYAGIFRANRPDYIFIESPPPLLAVAGIFAAKRWSIPSIVNVSDLWPDTARDLGLMRANSLMFRTAEKLERWVYRHADYVCAVTDGIRDTLLKRKSIPQSKLLFLPNGVDTSFYDARPCDEALKKNLGLEGKQVLVYPGTVGFAHDAGKFVRAARFLRNTNLHFLFVGGGSSKPELIRLADKLRLTNVTFHEPVSSDRVPSFLSIASCGLVSVRNAPILDGARPAKMFAIMSSGKPVIYAGPGEGAQLLLDAGAGVHVPEDDPEEIANHIRGLMDDPARLQKLGRNGRDYVIRHFSWPMLVKEWAAQLAAQESLNRASPRTTPEESQNWARP